MSLFNLSNKNEPKGEIKISENSAPPGKEEIKIRYLKKQATEYKKTDINKAIQLMKEAIHLERQFSYGDDSIISDSIRMAKYIYKAQQKDEAWKLYNDLILRCANIKEAYLRWYLWSNIYLAMSDQLLKENEYSNVLLHYFISLFCSMKRRIDSIEHYKKLESDGLIKSEEESLNDDIELMFSEGKIYIKEKLFPFEKRIRTELLAEFGGREKFSKDLNSMSLADFTNKVSKTLSPYKATGNFEEIAC
ncbi:MAG: hypothetical protein NT030_07895 [Candidatus Saganbacteria bacterium]|nr:hypothetical protein [Candidatus Saganbacteria bacterium]